MKKLLSFMICLLFIAAAAAVQTSAIGEELRASYGTPAIDGVKDGIWNIAQRQKFGYSVAGDLSDGSLPGSSSAFVSALWDENALYFFIEVSDNDYIFGREGEYGSDEIRIYIDEADWFGYTWRYGQVCLIIEPDANGKVEVIGDVSESTQAAYFEATDSRRYIEVKYVPTRLKTEKNASVLVDFRYNDVYEKSDGETGLAFSLTWSDELNEGDIDSSNWSYLRMEGSNSASGEGASTAEEAAMSINQPIISTYRFIEGTSGNANEGADMLFDGNVGTKFCTYDFPQSAVMRLNGEYIITGIIMATANDNSMYNGRSPDDWKIEGSADQKKWTVIAEGNDDFFREVNYTYFAMKVESDGQGYKYIRFSNKKCESEVMQLSELLVCGIKANSTQEEIDILLNPAEADASPAENAIYLPIIGSAAEAIAAPAAPGTDEGGFDSDMVVTVIVIAVSAALVVVCAVIAFIQSKQKRKNII